MADPPQSALGPFTHLSSRSAIPREAVANVGLGVYIFPDIALLEAGGTPGQDPDAGELGGGVTIVWWQLVQIRVAYEIVERKKAHKSVVQKLRQSWHCLATQLHSKQRMYMEEWNIGPLCAPAEDHIVLGFAVDSCEKNGYIRKGTIVRILNE
ncbi:hypothetical protein C8R44DRAFT_855101 [Mycena epipterygia]|nr:hypothetical protein C8R44DRAFT_855101 [Mycena epipterygia]